MSLYNDLMDVLTPYANKIKEVNESLGINNEKTDFIAEKSYTFSGNVVDTSQGTLVSGVPTGIYFNMPTGTYYKNPFATGGALVFKPYDASGNLINMRRADNPSTVVTTIAPNSAYLFALDVEPKRVVLRTFKNLTDALENNPSGGTYIYRLDSVPYRWMFTGSSLSSLNYGLTQGACQEEYVTYVEPTSEISPNKAFADSILSDYEIGSEIVNYKLYFSAPRWNESTGAQGANTAARCLGYIPADADRIFITDETKVAWFELLAWDSEDTYIGVWNVTSGSWSKSVCTYKSINLKEIVAEYPTYKFRMNANVVSGSGVAYLDIDKYIGFGYPKNRIISGKIADIDNAFLFDNNKITIVQNAYINGNGGGVALNQSNYVCTDYVDVSSRVNNEISFYSSIVANPIGCAWYDAGKNYLGGIWGNMSNLSELGYSSIQLPQKITVELPENACYIRASMYSSYYSQPLDFDFDFYEAREPYAEPASYKGNFMTIAHKGYSSQATENSLEAFIRAAEAGFKAVEIDCRKTSDGIWVCSHNDSVTLYASGTGTSYTIATTPWSDMKGKTLDSNGIYPLAKLSTVLNALRKYDVIFVLDRKVGTNAELLKLARRCGVENQIILSYYNQTSLSDDLSLLAKYPTVGVRFTPSLTKAQYDSVRDAIPNPLYADINFYDYRGSTKNELLCNALSYPIPILASGMSAETKNVIAPIASGAMSNTTLQYSPKDFIDAISLDYSQNPTLTASSNSISVGVGEEVSLTASSDINDPACYPYAYSDDLSIFKVSVMNVSAQTSIYVTGRSAGTANLIVFSATGEEIRIPVTVS